MGRVKIKDRIEAAIRASGGVIVYHELADQVFPRDEYPNAWRYPTRGGPPGCYMVLSRAIREHGFNLDLRDVPAVVYGTVTLGKNRKQREATP